MFDSLYLFDSRYGTSIAIIKSMLIEKNSELDKLMECGVRIWKASRLPVNYIAHKLEIDSDALNSAINDQIHEWRSKGVVTPKVDILGDLFERYFPECTCVRYTIAEIAKMELFSEIKTGELYNNTGLSPRNRYKLFAKTAKPVKKNIREMEKGDDFDERFLLKASDTPPSPKIKISTVNYPEKFNRFPEIRVGNII